MAAWAAPAAAVTWAIWPSIEPAARPLMDGAIQIGPVLVIVASTLFALWSAMRLLHMPGFDLGALEYLLPGAGFTARGTIFTRPIGALRRIHPVGRIRMPV